MKLTDFKGRDVIVNPQEIKKVMPWITYMDKNQRINGAIVFCKTKTLRVLESHEKVQRLRQVC